VRRSQDCSISAPSGRRFPADVCSQVRGQRARPRRSASGAGDTPVWSRHAVLVRWHYRHVAGRTLDVGQIRSGLRVVCCRLCRPCFGDAGGEASPRFPRAGGSNGGDNCEGPEVCLFPPGSKLDVVCRARPARRARFDLARTGDFPSGLWPVRDRFSDNAPYRPG
jgi:hypothetical protein